MNAFSMNPKPIRDPFIFISSTDFSVPIAILNLTSRDWREALQQIKAMRRSGYLPDPGPWNLVYWLAYACYLVKKERLNA